MRTKQQITSEIEALRKLKPVGTFANSTRSAIDLCIEELNFRVDDTADEWLDLSHTEQEAVLVTRRWKNGESDERPSEGWGELVS